MWNRFCQLKEQIANQLGVSAPAVNKWKNGISYPDIELLAPLARLLNISIDTLLSFQDEYEKVNKKIREFPNCNKLILWSAQILNAYLIMKFKETSNSRRNVVSLRI